MRTHPRNHAVETVEKMFRRHRFRHGKDGPGILAGVVRDLCEPIGAGDAQPTLEELWTAVEYWCATVGVVLYPLTMDEFTFELEHEGLYGRIRLREPNSAHVRRHCRYAALNDAVAAIDSNAIPQDTSALFPRPAKVT